VKTFLEKIFSTRVNFRKEVRGGEVKIPLLFSVFRSAPVLYHSKKVYQ
jgi:hypothetical protein